MASDILDPVKPNYCPLFKNLLQIQIKIFKRISLSWTLPNPLTKFHINDFYTNSNFMESRIKHSSASHFPILRQHQGLLGENITIFLGFDSFADDAVVGEQSELAGFHIF
jgi:hypothetical protein